MKRSELSDLAQAAITLNELYLTLQQSGFTPKEALYLVGQAMTTPQAGGRQ